MSVDKDVLYADRARYFPWRPRLWMAAYDILTYSAVAQVWAGLTVNMPGCGPSSDQGAAAQQHKQWELRASHAKAALLPVAVPVTGADCLGAAH